MGRLISINRNITTITGSTNNTQKDIHTFVDEHGNVTQIDKKDKTRLKYYIDPSFPEVVFESCAIGISEPFEGDCTYGVGLGVGDNTFIYAKYN
jgi:hypothetical protein